MPSNKKTDPEDFLLKRCVDCGVWCKTTRCSSCKPKAASIRHKNYDEAKRKADLRKFYGSYQWKKLSQKQKREYPYCQWVYEDGTMCRSTDRLASDHKIPILDGGQPLLQSNLQSLCHHHHSIKTGQETGSFIGRPHTTIICGPPGSGKTTYVMERAKQYDVILDLDRILGALNTKTSHIKPTYLMRCAWEMRDALIDHIQVARDIPRVWIIEGAPLLKRRHGLRDRLHAEVILLLPTPQQCKDRIKNAQDRDQSAPWDTWIDEWFEKYEPSSLDIVIN